MHRAAAVRNNMSLPDLKSAGKPRTPAKTPSPVVQLNVGGAWFTTCVTTLRKHPESRLARLLVDPTRVLTDPEGRVFIDRDPTHFGAVLDFLRSEQLPTRHITEVHREAVHYNIKALIKELEESPLMFGEAVGRQQFLSRVPHYRENIQVLIRIGRAEAVASRRSSVLFCVLRSEEEAAALADAAGALAAERESAVTFGPWTSAPSVQDLLDCVRTDIQNQGYTVEVQPHVQNLLFKSYHFFYRLIFTWW